LATWTRATSVNAATQPESGGMTSFSSRITERASAPSAMAYSNTSRPSVAAVAPVFSFR
jgi:hypothetical protein